MSLQNFPHMGICHDCGKKDVDLNKELVCQPCQTAKDKSNEIDRQQVEMLAKQFKERQEHKELKFN